MTLIPTLRRLRQGDLMLGINVSYEVRPYLRNKSKQTKAGVCQPVLQVPEQWYITDPYVLTTIITREVITYNLWLPLALLVSIM